MIDIHCHILPMIDDGSASMEESVAMARLAAASGVTDIAATPHFRGDLQSISMVPRILHGVEEFRRMLQTEQIPVTIHPGAEILCLPETVNMARRRQLPTIGDTNYILTEFYFDESWEYMDGAVKQLQALGYRPIVAHPERYGAVQESPRRIWEWFSGGIVVQVNKGSVLGAFGGRVKQTALGLLDKGMVHLIASDAHGADIRTPHMGALEYWADQNLSPYYQQILFEENPRRILQGRDMAPVD